MSAHTPGPWKRAGSERTVATWVVGPDGKRICSMRACEQDWQNAALIAAAPTMVADRQGRGPLMSARDGGPAFPHDGSYGVTPGPGMTLRDYFAAAALTGLCAAQDHGIWTSDARNAARFAYDHADALLAERAK